MPKNDNLDICVYPTSVRIKMKDERTAANGLPMSEFINSLTEFAYSERMRTWLAIRKYGIYEPSTKIASVPRYYLKDIVDYAKYYNTEVNIFKASTNPGRDVKYKLNPWWKPRPEQIPALNFLTDPTSPHDMRALPLFCGFGKTISSIMAVCAIGKPVIIILNSLIDQWYDTIVTGRKGKQPPALNIDKSDVYTIQGQKSLVDLIEAKEYKPSIILASLSTIRNYIQANMFPYNELMPFGQLMEEKGIGIKINDESHQAFSAIVDIDLRCNIKHNLYLSATLTRGDKQSKKIFDKVFPPVIRYDPGEAKKYIEVFYHSYNIGVFSDRSVAHPKYGYNQNKYEGSILNDLPKKIGYFEVIRNYFYSYYYNNKNRKPGHKCLILASTRLMVEELQYFFASEYPDIKVGTYFGDNDLADLVNYDLIISTSKKGSTGTDIDKLFVLINTLSIGSEILPLQIMGRLRELKDGTTPLYICMYNEGVTAHYRHYIYCRSLYRQRAVKYNDYTKSRDDV